MQLRLLTWCTKVYGDSFSPLSVTALGDNLKDRSGALTPTAKKSGESALFLAFCWYSFCLRERSLQINTKQFASSPRWNSCILCFLQDGTARFHKVAATSRYAWKNEHYLHPSSRLEESVISDEALLVPGAQHLNYIISYYYYRWLGVTQCRPSSKCWTADPKFD